jgi:glucose-6-phosphate dehydrogenase assembly protein OpcA
MPGAPQLETFTAGVETAVDVAGIERQLHELWQLAAESERDPPSRAVAPASAGEGPARRLITRASLFNFVVFCETDAARDHATETISELTSREPCRAIVLLAKPAEPQTELSASITAHCHLAGGSRKQVCCEQISIRASGSAVEHVASAVLPLLESDLPTVVWWQGNFLLQPQPFTRLGAVADRILFDTSLWAAPEQYLAALAKTIQAMPHTNFGDLSWTRLGLWRKLTAEFFDDPQCRAELERIRSVEVVHGCGPGARLRAVLFASWFAVQLGWSSSDAAKKIRLQARDDSDATSVGILSITLTSPGATFCVRKNYGEHTASAAITMPDACGLPRKRAFWPTNDVSLLSQELDHSARHSVYERSLTLAAVLADEFSRTGPPTPSIRVAPP